MGSQKIRYFACGEYGEENGRPHYHVAVFGYRGCDYGDSRLSPRVPCSCVSCVLLRRTWELGLVHQGVIERKSMQYIAGYTVKGMTGKDDRRLQGRSPEFAKMSLRPGIGAEAMEDVVRVLDQYGIRGEVPGALRHGSAILPLGRYLRDKLRAYAGLEKSPVDLERWYAELQALREIAASLSDKEVYVEGTFDQGIFKALVVEQDAEKVRQLEARRKLYERGKK